MVTKFTISVVRCDNDTGSPARGRIRTSDYYIAGVYDGGSLVWDSTPTSYPTREAAVEAARAHARWRRQTARR